MSEFASYRTVMPNDTAATAAYFTSKNRIMMPFSITFFLQYAADLKIEKIHACSLGDCITIFTVLIFLEKPFYIHAVQG